MGIWEQQYSRSLMGFRALGITPFTYIFRYVYPTLPIGLKVIVYNQIGTKLMEFGEDIQEGVLGEVNCEFIETGCGAFSFTLLKEPPQEIKYNYRIEVYLFSFTRYDPWYSGYIIDRPKEGSTERPYRYGGFGYFNQLETCKVDKSYTNTELSDIVKDIMTTFVVSNTDIVYKENNIEWVGYEIQSVNFDKISAKEALRRLGETAQNYIVGVNAQREFFFNPIDTSVNFYAIKSVGKHMEAFVYDEDIEPIRNDLDILGGSIQDKSNFLINVQDATSIAAYGRRWGKLTAPEILDQADAQRWGNWQLSKLKDPVQKGAVKNVELFQKKIEAEGKARIFDKDGNKIELAIKKVRYRCSSSGIIANLELGELELPVEREIVNLLRDLEKERALAQANVKSLAP